MRGSGLAPDYDASFHSYTDAIAARSAKVVAPLVHRLFRVRSVVDFGCGRGVWLAEWKRLGVREVLGVNDGSVEPMTLHVDPGEFQVRDLTHAFDLGRRFDLVQSLEVGEHLPAGAAEAFVEVLTSHGDRVLFSAAPPGQGGFHHINERPYEYWRELFARRRFLLLDPIRPAILGERRAAPWYRYNTFMYVHESVFESLETSLRSFHVPSERTIRDLSPVAYRVRKALLRRLPRGMVDRLSLARMAWAERDRRTARRR